MSEFVLPAAGDDHGGLRYPDRRRILVSPRLYVALGVFVVLVVAFVAGPVIAPYTPTGVDPTALNTPPSLAHPFGTDPIGRDLLVRTLVAGRTSLLTAVLVAGLTTVIGVGVGALAGYRGGALDVVLSQIINLVLIVPALVVLLVTATRFATGPVSVAVLLAALLWPMTARLVRAEVLALRDAEFVASAVSIGAGGLRIFRRHLLPHLVGLIVVNATLLLAAAVVIESTLAFLGLGVPPPTPTLGGLVGAGRSYLESNPVVVLAPTAVIVAFTLSVHVIGDAVRAGFDPTTVRR